MDAPNARGESKELTVTGLNLGWAHFHLVALVTKEQGQSWEATWDMSPGSHDTTWTEASEPGSLALLSAELLGLGLLRRKRPRRS